MSWWVMRRMPIPVAPRVASTPASKLLNSESNSSCSRRERSMHFLADKLELLLDFIFRFHSKSGDSW